VFYITRIADNVNVCFQSGPRFKIELELRNVDFYGGKKTGEKPPKQGENQQQTQLTYDTKSGNRTRITVVRGKSLNSYATHASYAWVKDKR
jgi:hypothetical protein